MKGKRIISSGLIISIVSCSLINCMYPICVFALSFAGLQSTIASIIISLMLECGVAPVNSTWLNTLNTSFGVASEFGTIQNCIDTGLLTQTASGLVDTGLTDAIANTSAYTDLGLSEIFTTTADDVAAGVVAGSGAFNIATTAINVGTVGTIGAFAGAAAVGVGLGVLINHLREKFFPNVGSGIPMDYTTFITGIPANSPWYLHDWGGSEVLTVTVPTTDANQLWGRYIQNGNMYLVNNSLNGYRYVRDHNYDKNTGTLRIDSRTELGTQNKIRQVTGYIDSNYPLFENVSDYDIYKNGVMNGSIQKPSVYAPDLIGTEGNQFLNEDEIPDQITNSVPEGYDMKPVDMNDFLIYADNANDNTNNGDIGKEVQGTDFDNLIDSLLVEPSIIPDQGVEDPVVPDRPIIPDQPETPAKDPITGEQQSDVLEGITTPDLRSVFPFCIPFDLYNILGVMKYEGREAPVIVWNFEILGNSYPVIIDLSPYEDVAALLRLLELLVFIVGLAVATRKLIGAGG